MADSKITALTSISTSTDPANDPLVIVDVSDTSMAATGTTKKVTLNNLLACSPTATLASATITGDLTVDTSTLYVSSSADKVGIGTTSLSNEKLTVAGNISANAWLGRSNIAAPAGDCSIFRSADNTLGFGIASSTAMTLNSTGLGLGVSPVTALSFPIGTNKVVGQSATSSHAAGNVGSLKFGIADGGGDYSGIQIFNTHNGTYSSQDIRFFTGEGGVSVCTERMRITPSGNVGIGVTPSAWAAGYKGLQLKDSYAGLFANTSSGISELVSNAYNDGAWKFANAGNGAARYQMDALNRTHAWFYAATSANPITWTQAMTLDSGGNLLVAATSTSLTTGTGLKILQNSGVTTVGTVGSSSSDVDTTYRLYSSAASAYRFYVGYGGTVYATNTTISAISDARLKENVQDIDVGLGAILALKPRKFDWKAGKGKDIKGDRGFIAQEFEQVFPQLVDEWADPSPEGEAPYKSVRQDLIPVLVKAIQELTARVQTLENR